MLSEAVIRCLGQLPVPMGTVPCPKRKTCARYVQRYHGNAPIKQWMCPDADHYYGKYIEQEAK